MSDNNPTPAEKILGDSQGPAAATGDTGSATAHSIPNRIAAANYAAQVAAGRRGMGGIRRVKLAPGNPSGLNVGRYSDL
jgi:hypothetical protein